MTWTGKYKLGGIAWARVGKYNLGIRAEYKLGARAGGWKYKYPCFYKVVQVLQSVTVVTKWDVSYDETRNQKSWKCCGIYYKNMFDINRETNERNGVETIIDSNGILWLNERHAKDGLNHKKFGWLQENIFQIMENIDIN